MRNNVKVKFKLDRLCCYDEADGWGDAEPYLWTVFFKIDGTTCRLNDSLMLEGTATIYTTPGSHGNLGDTSVDAGDTVTVPSAIGFHEMTLIPIPVSDIAKSLGGIDDLAAVAGCIAVLMEEDNVTDDGAEAAHQALNAGIENAINAIIPTLGYFKREITDEDIENLTSAIKPQIEAAIENQQNGFENAWSWLNPDDKVGKVVWRFDTDRLLRENPLPLRERWCNGYGDWELFGSVTSEEIPACPAEVIKVIFEGIFGASSSSKSMQSMYDFRDKDMSRYNGLNSWWELARKNSHYLKAAMTTKEVSQSATALFKDIPEILSNRDKPLSDEHFNNALKVLEHIATLNTKDRHSRKDISRSIAALKMLRGKSPKQIFEFLAKTRPARYPSLDANESKQESKGGKGK